MLNEFRTFVLRGNVVDLAVGIMIGAAFTAVVSSFVADILTPLLGLLGVPDFSEATFDVGTATVRYGVFLNAIISFLLLAAAIYFLVVRPTNTMMDRYKTETETTSPTSACPECLSSIPEGARRCAFCTAVQPSASASA